jgi:hypothetical protein
MLRHRVISVETKSHGAHAQPHLEQSGPGLSFQAIEVPQHTKMAWKLPRPSSKEVGYSGFRVGARMHMIFRDLLRCHCRRDSGFLPAMWKVLSKRLIYSTAPRPNQTVKCLMDFARRPTPKWSSSIPGLAHHQSIVPRQSFIPRTSISGNRCSHSQRAQSLHRFMGLSKSKSPSLRLLIPHILPPLHNCDYDRDCDCDKLSPGA